MKSEPTLKNSGQRRTAKRNRLVETLRREIVDGRLRPGAQLPPQSVLSRQFALSSVTVQLALERLGREGFIYTRYRRGTFVAEKPPHTNNYALVFWNDPAARSPDFQWSRYDVAMTNAAIALHKAEGRRIIQFHGIGEHTDSEDRQQLLGYIHAHRLAGIVFARTPAILEGTPILDEPGLARVAFMSLQVFPHVPAIAFDGRQWLTKALDHFAAIGRKRVAMILCGLTRAMQEGIAKEIADRGMTCPTPWQQVVSVHMSHSARHCAQLLMYGGGPGAQRPDALLIWDDNVADDALAGLMDVGVRVPNDLAVVSQANYPCPPSTVRPVRLLGYDSREALRMAFDLIDRQRGGEQVTGPVLLPARFEEELIEPAPASARTAAHTAASMNEVFVV